MERTKLTNFRNKEYVVKYPNVKGFLAMEESKLRLSKNKYMELIISSTYNSIMAAEIIETLAVLPEVCPDLAQSLQPLNLLDAEMDDIIELVAFYHNEIQPWMEEWKNTLLTMREELTSKKQDV